MFFSIAFNYINGRLNLLNKKEIKMLKKKYKQFKDIPNESKLDQLLWLIENYLPQKKDQSAQNKLYQHNLESKTINLFSKLASLINKKSFPTTKNSTISFTFGNWALPYLKLLKKIGIAKS